MLVVVVPVRLLVALLLVFVEELLAEVLAAEEVALIEMVASVAVAFVCLGPTIKRELLTVGMLVVVGIVVLVLLLLVAAKLLLEASGGAVEFILMEILASIVTELLCPAPKVKKEPLMSKIVPQKIRVIMTSSSPNRRNMTSSFTETRVC